MALSGFLWKSDPPFTDSRYVDLLRVSAGISSSYFTRRRLGEIGYTVTVTVRCARSRSRLPGTRGGGRERYLAIGNSQKAKLLSIRADSSGIGAHFLLFIHAALLLRNARNAQHPRVQGRWKRGVPTYVVRYVSGTPGNAEYCACHERGLGDKV